MTVQGTTENPLYKTAQELGLTIAETDEVIAQLRRQPTLTELSMISVEWSEHCSYRRSRSYFSKFPRTGSAPALVGEDAGGIVIDDLAVIFKVESHNHPSQVEPKHGAATGVGGIIRDIIGSGARPVALLNSLRFGPLNDANNRALFRGVVDGIQWYGNSIGIPTVGGEIDFHPSYASNCLVNVMCIGVAPENQLLSSKSKPGHAVLILGARTGRDGIGGCSVLASQELQEELSKRPTVQIGDPYFGKCLMEATLEAAAKNLFVAVKDMGAAGLTCTTSEMSAAGKCGMEVDVAKIPARESGMEPWEFMMSESQERMLAVVAEQHIPEVKRIFEAWGLEAAVIGKTIPEEIVKIMNGEAVVASLSTKILVEAPQIPLPFTKPKAEEKKIKLPKITDGMLLKFLAHPSLVSKAWAWKQYDSMVQTGTVFGPGGDAAVVRVPGKPWGIAATMEGNGRYVYLDPVVGSQYVLAEAARNLIAAGATPLAVTDGLNFGNPDKPEAFGEFVGVMEGLSIGCKALGLPVVSGNVSFYNETSEPKLEVDDSKLACKSSTSTLRASELQAPQARHNESDKGRILPTPILGMVGKIDDVRNVTPTFFKNAGDLIYLVGDKSESLAGSLFLEELGIESEPLVPVDWEKTINIHKTILRLHEKNLLQSCHDLSQGGLLNALCECAVESGLGTTVSSELSIEALVSEAPSRFLLTCAPSEKKAVESMMLEAGVSFSELGIVGGEELALSPNLKFSLSELTKIQKKTLPKLMG